MWVTDTDAPSYLTHSVSNLQAMTEEDKRKYVSAVEARRGSFVVTVDGAMGPEAVLFLRRLVESYLRVGRGAMVRYWVGLRNGFPSL